MLMSNYQDDENYKKVLEVFVKCGITINPIEALDIVLKFYIYPSETM